MGIGTKPNPNYDPSSAYPTPVDYSQTLPYLSDNHKTVELAQIQSQQFQMHQLSLDREMQSAASIEMAIEGLDTKLQVSSLEYLQQMAAEENRHVEKMAKGRATYNRSSEAGIPEFKA
jgi:hypothetical protein